MQITDLNHINIVAPKDKLKLIMEFYTEILGFKIGPRPNFRRDGFWLYSNEKALVHLTEGESIDVKSGLSLDHIAFMATDVESAIKKLNNHGVSYKRNEIKELQQTQLFFKDPAGLGVELNFLSESRS